MRVYVKHDMSISDGSHLLNDDDDDVDVCDSGVAQV
jgi:hypothetical protein